MCLLLPTRGRCVMFKMVLQPEAEEWLRGGSGFFSVTFAPFRLDINPTHPLTSALVKGNYRLWLQLAVTPRWSPCFLAFFPVNSCGRVKVKYFGERIPSHSSLHSSSISKLVNQRWECNSQIRSNQHDTVSPFTLKQVWKFGSCFLNRLRKRQKNGSENIL